MYQGYGGYTYGANSYNINPMQPQMDRMNFLQQQQMQQSQQMQNQQPAQQNNQSVIPVGGIEEVKAHPVDWSGAPNYFMDNANNKIYIKQIGMDGTPKIRSYILDETPIQEKTMGDFVSKKEFDLLKKEIEEYKKILNNFLGGNANEQSNANDANVSTNDE